MLGRSLSRRIYSLMNSRGKSVYQDHDLVSGYEKMDEEVPWVSIY